MASTIELLDRLEEILKEALGQDKAREFKTILAKLYENSVREIEEKEFPILEERLREKLKEELATKGDIYELKAEIEKLRGEVEKTKTELLKWIIGLFLAQTTFITGLVLAIIKLFTKS